MSRSLTLILLTLLLSLPMTASARTPIYDVEVLLFTQPVTSAEQWPAYPGMPDMSKAGPMMRKGVTQGKTNRLAGIKKRLAAAPGYRPISHLRWRQSLRNNVVGKPFKVEVSDGDSRITGTISLGRSIFAKIKVDLLLQEGGRSYRMKGSRRMRRNEVHYLDHPKLGVITTITKIQ